MRKRLFLILLFAIALALPAFAQACTANEECEPRGPGFECNDSSQCEWVPPIGVPVPEFGLEESYLIYNDPVARNADLNYSPNTAGGYYTHYVDNTAPGGCDNGTNGNSANPRCNIPLNLPEGSVVEVHGGPYTGDRIILTANGTVEKPVYLRGLSQAEMGVVHRRIRFVGTYLIIEHLNFDNGGWVVFHRTGSQDFMSFRHSEVQNGYGVWINTARNIVVYNNELHDSPTYHGVELWEEADGNTARIWVIDNHMYNVNDGLQACCYWSDGEPEYVYIARNDIHDTVENAIDVKIGKHVIISENKLRGFAVSPTSNGDAIRLNDEGDMEEIWVIYNDISNSVLGIETWGTPFPAYIVGNKIYNLSGNSTRGIGGDHAGYVINNMIYSVDRGISERNAVIANNIISNVTSYHIDDGADVRNNLLWQDGQQVTVTSAVCVDCVEEDPLFLDADSGDFHLVEGSPAIDAGTYSSEVEYVYNRFEELYGISIRKDFEGITRPQDGDSSGSAEWDIGAYEFEGSACVDTDALLNYISNWEQGSINMPYLISRPY